jgi:hypothetical protein
MTFSAQYIIASYAADQLDMYDVEQEIQLWTDPWKQDRLWDALEEWLEKHGAWEGYHV